MKSKMPYCFLAFFLVMITHIDSFAQTKDSDFIPVSLSDETWEYRLKTQDGKSLIQINDCKTAHPFVKGFARIESLSAESYFIDYNGNSPTPGMMTNVKRLGQHLFSYFDALGSVDEIPGLYFFDSKENKTIKAPSNATNVFAIRKDITSESFLLLMNFPEISKESYPVYTEWGEEVYDEYGNLVYTEYETYINHWFVYNEQLERIFAEEVETYSFYSTDMLYTECEVYGPNYYEQGEELVGEEYGYYAPCPVDLYHNPFVTDNISFNGTLFTFKTKETEFYGAIDTKGNLVIPFILLNHQPDKAGYYLYIDQSAGGKYGFMNGAGKVVIKATYSDAIGFDDSGTTVAAVNGKYGIINKKGKFVLKPQFDFISYSDPKNMRLVEKDGFNGKVNAQGKLVIQIIYQELFDWGPDMLFAKKNNLAGIIDNSGKELLSFRFAEISHIIPEKRLAIVVTMNGHYGVAKFNVGTSEPVFLIPAEYQYIEYTPDGFILTLNQKKGFADPKGQFLIPIEFDDLYYVHDGILEALNNQMMGLYKTNGEIIIEPMCNSIKNWSNMYVCQTNNSTIFINEKGQIVQPEISTKSGSLIDESGNSYQTVIINDTQWMAENLRTTKFTNGDPIPQAKTAAEWMDAAKNGKPAWCYYNNDKANETEYGILYNWYAVSDERGLVPQGWQIPTWNDFSNLTDYLGWFIDNNEESLIMKGKGWQITHPSDSNLSGFNATPSGIRYFEKGLFANAGYSSGWWLRDEPEPYYYGETGEDLSAKAIAIQPNNHHMQFLYLHRGSGLAIRAFNPNPGK